MLSRMERLIGDRHRPIALLTLTAILSALSEAVLLALVAQVAATLVKVHGTHVRLSLVHIHAPTATLIAIAFAIAVIRLLLQIPLAILPARIAADVQAQIRTNLFDSFSRASWEIQSREREGQLQETMTSQVGQATVSVVNFLGLITSTVTFLVLLASAFALNLFAACIVLVLGGFMFALLRPLRGLGRRRARSLSEAQVGYAAGVAESIRLAEETHVFGADAAQRGLIDELIGRCRKLFFETQILMRLGANISQSLVYLLLVGGLALLHAKGATHAGSLGAVVLILVRASSSGQGIQSSYQGVIQAQPFVERIQETERRYRDSARHEGTRALSRVSTLAFASVG
jgi:ATP-binding cassette subfamily B protein